MQSSSKTLFGVLLLGLGIFLSCDKIDSLVLENTTIGLNTDPFADPDIPNQFEKDSRTPGGEEYALTFLGITVSYPNGMVNRSSILNNTQDNVQIKHNSWETAIERLKDLEPEVSIELALTFNSENNSIDVTSTTYPLVELEGKYNLVLSLVENNVVGPQKDSRKEPSEILDYVHQHVFRGNLNSTWGTPIIEGVVIAGEPVKLAATDFII